MHIYINIPTPPSPCCTRALFARMLGVPAETERGAAEESERGVGEEPTPCDSSFCASASSRVRLHTLVAYLKASYTLVAYLKASYTSSLT